MPTFDDVSEKETEELSMNENYANIVENSNEDDFNISAFPNPFDNEFVLKISTKFNDDIFLKIVDITGKTIEEIKINNNESFNLGNNFKNGLYYLIISQNNINEIIKVIKNNCN
jgi:hypothetical protein